MPPEAMYTERNRERERKREKKKEEKNEYVPILIVACREITSGDNGVKVCTSNVAKFCNTQTHYFTFHEPTAMAIDSTPLSETHIHPILNIPVP